MKIKYLTNHATKEQIYYHLKECDKWFVPALSTRIKLKKFSKKIFNTAIVFEAWDKKKLIGMVSAYFNDPYLKSGFINNVSIAKVYWKKNIAFTLLSKCIQYGENNNFSEIILEVSKNNNALNLYKKIGFSAFKTVEHLQFLKYKIRKESN